MDNIKLEQLTKRKLTPEEAKPGTEKLLEQIRQRNQNGQIELFENLKKNEDVLKEEPKKSSAMV